MSKVMPMNTLVLVVVLSSHFSSPPAAFFTGGALPPIASAAPYCLLSVGLLVIKGAIDEIASGLSIVVGCEVQPGLSDLGFLMLLVADVGVPDGLVLVHIQL